MTSYYLYIKALHIIFIICWMVGLLYLPRLFVYHTKAKIGGELDVTLKVMESKLYYFIMLPSIIGSITMGMLLLYLRQWHMTLNMHIKLTAVFILIIMHIMMGYHLNRFRYALNRHTQFFFRVLNEVPSILLIIIIFAIVLE